jgi:hypothetical protein
MRLALGSAPETRKWSEAGAKSVGHRARRYCAAVLATFRIPAMFRTLLRSSDRCTNRRRAISFSTRSLIPAVQAGARARRGRS